MAWTARLDGPFAQNDRVLVNVIYTDNVSQKLLEIVAVDRLTASAFKAQVVARLAQLETSQTWWTTAKAGLIDTTPDPAPVPVPLTADQQAQATAQAAAASLQQAFRLQALGLVVTQDVVALQKQINDFLATRPDLPLMI